MMFQYSPESSDDIFSTEPPLSDYNDTYSTPEMSTQKVPDTPPPLIRKKQKNEQKIADDIYDNHEFTLPPIVFDQTEDPTMSRKKRVIMSDEAASKILAPMYSIVQHTSITTKFIARTFLQAGIITEHVVKLAVSYMEKIFTTISPSDFTHDEYVAFTSTLVLAAIFMAHKMLEDKPFSNVTWYEMMHNQAKKIACNDIEWNFYQTFYSYLAVNITEIAMAGYIGILPIMFQ